MSEIMTCMPFSHLMNWVMEEQKSKETIFGIHKYYKANPDKALHIFERPLETLIGPAAGPNSQLAQNIIASYVAGARFFDLKTVQIMDGAELAKCVNKPCIKADDECYNCEWSTELYVHEAQDEYIKAWFVLYVLAKEFGLGGTDGYQFNISVGYDLKGIQSEKVDTFINNMMEAKDTAVFKECKAYLLEHAGEFKNLTKEDIEAIPSNICNSMTISTLHGCPPTEIESIATYLLKEKHIHTFVKCNPTLLGYEFARETMDSMGYDYMAFGRFHFDDDLQYEDAIPMFRRLIALSEELKLEFGVKITNTFPTDVTKNELPSEEMYMSGRSLYPLSISLAAKLSKEFDGKLRIAYSGGADFFNIDRIVGCGIWPVTMATTILKPGGYNRFTQIAEKLEAMGVPEFHGIDVAALEKVAKEALTDPHHTKAAKPNPSRKSEEIVPLLNCYTAPCEDRCPIHQDVSTYMKLAGEENYEEAFRVILDKNALPFMTGTICAHDCMTACSRNFYETPVQIRDTKLTCAQKAYDKVIGEVKVLGSANAKVAVVGGGPAGMASAYYLARAGAQVTIFEKEEKLGGIVRTVIPDFRIDGVTIDKDISLLEKLGVEIKTGVVAPSVDELKKAGYSQVILAVGAYVRGALSIPGIEVQNALEFLEQFKVQEAKLGKKVVVIGGGNTAMDTARAAKRCSGVEEVSLIYRRTKRYMPADEEELLMALEDGVVFRELLAPEKVENGQLFCKKMELGEEDASGRASVKETGEVVSFPVDNIIAAVGEKVPADFYREMGIAVDEKGLPKVNPDTLESSQSGVYVVGDGLYGPKIVVTVMSHAMKAAESILGKKIGTEVFQKADHKTTIEKKGILCEPNCGICEGGRCLSCSTVCENCVDVCPNRANISLEISGMEMAQVIHVDYMCNECGNCKSFCPYASAPYKDKFTLYHNEESFKDSTNNGVLILDRASKKVKTRLYGVEKESMLSDAGCDLPEGIVQIIEALLQKYEYMIL